MQKKNKFFTAQNINHWRKYTFFFKISQIFISPEKITKPSYFYYRIKLFLYLAWSQTEIPPKKPLKPSESDINRVNIQIEYHKTKTTLTIKNEVTVFRLSYLSCMKVCNLNLNKHMVKSVINKHQCNNEPPAFLVKTSKKRNKRKNNT